ncbi:MAG: long-chain fatty acid--CoA ligase [Mycolicibacterium sp.]|nr:long-chain fatty acid--CoA ligase [Mycolicibacterium sp.]
MRLAVTTVGEALARQRSTAHPLLVCDGERLGYAEADERSARLARSLVALGAGKGTHVGVLFPNGAAFVVAALAAARIGAVVVPFSTFSTPAELRRQLRAADVAILLATGGHRGNDFRGHLGEILGRELSDLAGPLLNPELPQLRWLSFDLAVPEPDAVSAELIAAMADDVTGADPLAIIYTSGSTSEPKGVVHTHAGLLGHQDNLNAIRGLSADDRLFCNSPFFWIGGFAFGLLATLVADAELLCSNATDPGAILDLIEAERPTVTNGFIAGIATLTRHPGFAGRDLSSLRRGNLYPIMAPECRPADPELRHNMLGLTEGGSVVLLDGDESDQPEHRRGSYGRPAPGFSAKVIDAATGAELRAGQVGELCLRGPYLMAGYYGRRREECFDDDGWFHTGDLVRTDDDGYFYYLGRAGAMIKTAGANVAPPEVERAISAVTGAPAYVLGLPEMTRGEIVAAVVVADDPAACDVEALRSELRNTLSAYKVPRRILVLRAGEVPLRSSGKPDLPALRALF